MEEDKGEQSKYNEAMLQIQRLHGSWTRCNMYARSGNLSGWKWELDIVWRELRPDVKKMPKPEETTQENIKHKQAIASATTRTEMYDALNDRHEFLKILQDTVGKGGVWEDAYADDFD